MMSDGPEFAGFPICAFTGKIGFPSRKAAHKQIKRVIRRRSDRDQPPLQPYECRRCGRWHFGHRSVRRCE